ncbi:hypothetical protein B0H66DRAFT_252326 [Apodospora peruviana]|uniref:Ribosomal protein YmL11, mitochondrial n=1 Tax=Apodospora peruviana TaxID=516989 RepID=A0AAE0I5E8_9PEZI|nr:hypothetical protein B0H66DRAFT_252326 [Apodospora peruviana]
MPPRLRCPTARGMGLGSALGPSSRRVPTLLILTSITTQPSTQTRPYAAAAAPSISVAGGLNLPDGYVPPTRPPTARPADARKAQLLRTYTSLLRSTPLMLIFQHNNLTAVEWAAIRRELRRALAEVQTPTPPPVDFVSKIQLQVIRTRIFDVALKVVEFHDPSRVAPTTVKTASGAKTTMKFDHDLSEAAYEAIKAATASGMPESSQYAELSPLLVGPCALLTIPAVSPAHLAAALNILAPSPPAFPAPSRKKNPGYWDPIAQSGLQKLLLVGGRIEGKVFDLGGVRWVGGIENGLDGLRAQLVHMLQNAGLGLTSVLEGAGKSLWLTMESRRSVLEEAEKPAAEPAAEGEGEKKE